MSDLMKLLSSLVLDAHPKWCAPRLAPQVFQGSKWNSSTCSTIFRWLQMSTYGQIKGRLIKVIQELESCTLYKRQNATNESHNKYRRKKRREVELTALLCFLLL